MPKLKILFFFLLFFYVQRWISIEVTALRWIFLCLCEVWGLKPPLFYTTNALNTPGNSVATFRKWAVALCSTTVLRYRRYRPGVVYDRVNNGRPNSRGPKLVRGAYIIVAVRVMHAIAVHDYHYYYYCYRPRHRCGA